MEGRFLLWARDCFHDQLDSVVDFFESTTLFISFSWSPYAQEIHETISGLDHSLRSSARDKMHFLYAFVFSETRGDASDLGPELGLLMRPSAKEKLLRSIPFESPAGSSSETSSQGDA